MDFYPLNLVVAVAVSAAMIFLGFLPTRHLRAAFFEKEVVKAAFAWTFVAMTMNSQITHYPVVIILLLFASWWALRRDQLLGGKMWLSIASGLAISVGVMLILVTTPRAYPPELSEQNRALLLASIYLGGGVVGLAYICMMLTRNLRTNADLSTPMVRNYIGLLVGLVVARAAVLVLFLCLTPDMPGHFHSVTTFYNGVPATTQAHLAYTEEGSVHAATLLVAILAVAVLPILALAAQTAFKAGAMTRAWTCLGALSLIGFFAEIGARWQVL